MAIRDSIFGSESGASFLLLRAVSPIVALQLPWIRTANYLAHVFRSGARCVRASSPSG